MIFTFIAMAFSVFLYGAILSAIAEAFERWKARKDYPKKVLQAIQIMQEAHPDYNERMVRGDPVYQTAFTWMLQHPDEYDLKFLRRQPSLMSVYIRGLEEGEIMI